MNNDLYKEVEGTIERIAINLCDMYGSDDWVDIPEGERKDFLEMAEFIIKPILLKISRFT